MSRDSLYVDFSDGTRLWGIYNGTVDELMPRLFRSRGEAWDTYTRGGLEALCAHGPEPDDAEVVSVRARYGGSSLDAPPDAWRAIDWQVKASKEEMRIVGPLAEAQHEGGL